MLTSFQDSLRQDRPLKQARCWFEASEPAERRPGSQCFSLLPCLEQNSCCIRNILLTVVHQMAETMATQTQPVLEGHVPSEKEKKYDRQLRLWAASGQAALESANILLFNTGSGAVGVEALKNLVLPGKVVP